MAKTAADILIATIHDWGVDVIFGLPGNGINGIMEALRKRQDEVRFIQVRNEEAAAFCMGFNAQDSVVDQWCRTRDVPNLLVCNGSVLPTQGSANPALTISALAACTADWLRTAVPRGELN